MSVKSPLRSSRQTPVALTDHGRKLIAHRIHGLRRDVLDQLRPHLMGPDRDPRNVADFERALEEISRLEGLLASAERLPEPATGRRAVVSRGSLVWLRAQDTGERIEVRLVHPEEAALDSERISWDSPLAVAILGARTGDVRTVESPRGRWTCEVRRILR